MVILSKWSVFEILDIIKRLPKSIMLMEINQVLPRMEYPDEIKGSPEPGFLGGLLNGAQ